MRLPVNAGRLGWISAFLVTTGLFSSRPAAADGRLELTVVDRDTGRPVACRIHLKNRAGQPVRVRRAAFWNDHFVIDGRVSLDLRPGPYTFEIERGPEYAVRRGHFQIDKFSDDATTVDLSRRVDMAKEGWWAGDLDVRRPVEDIELLMLAEDLHVVPLITGDDGKNQLAGKAHAESVVRFDGNRFYGLINAAEQRPGGELLYFGLPEPLQARKAESEYPSLAQRVDQLRETARIWVEASRPYWWDVPTLAATARLDSVQVAHGNVGRLVAVNSEAGGKPRDRLRYPPPGGNARWSQQVYFHLLDCGLRIPPTAGSGSGESDNPVGYNRVYVHVDGEVSYGAWWENLRAGRVVVTNGPLLRPWVNGQMPGHIFRLQPGQKLDLQVGLTLSRRGDDPIHYIELIVNGEVKHSVRFEEYAKTGRLPDLHFDQSGWFLIRAVTNHPKTYRFAMTGPYYVQIGYAPRISRKSVRFFLDWLDERMGQIELDDPVQQQQVLADHRRAKAFFEDLLEHANTE